MKRRTRNSIKIWQRETEERERTKGEKRAGNLKRRNKAGKAKNTHERNVEILLLLLHLLPLPSKNKRRAENGGF